MRTLKLIYSIYLFGLHCTLLFAAIVRCCANQLVTHFILTVAVHSSRHLHCSAIVFVHIRWKAQRRSRQKEIKRSRCGHRSNKRRNKCSSNCFHVWWQGENWHTKDEKWLNIFAVHSKRMGISENRKKKNIRQCEKKKWLSARAQQHALQLLNPTRRKNYYTIF